MTLLITVFAAVYTTFKWYTGQDDTLNISMLCFMFWGASIMDAVFEYAELGTEYFTPVAGDMLNDAFLGLSVVAFALVIWIAALLIRDPRGVVADTLHKQIRR